MADFKQAYKHTAAIEGGYANHPNDKGGETYKGIARKRHPNWNGWSFIDAIKKKVGPYADRINREGEKDATLQQYVFRFYKEQFWDALNLDHIKDERVARELYDTGVNMGTGRAALFFQRVLNVLNRGERAYPNLRLDAIVGPNTITRFNQLSESDRFIAWKLLNCLQGEKYISICENDESQEIFMRSWASRVFEN